MQGRIFKKASRFFGGVILTVFSLTSLIPLSPAQAQLITLDLPSVGTMIAPSAAFAPSSLKGIKIDPENPMYFEFLLDDGDQLLTEGEQAEEYQKHIRYFMSALTTPEEDMWVNLSPHEGGRIIPDEFALTEMGRDLLGQDYILKQLTASLVYPDGELGKRFWDKVYQKAFARYGTTDIPVNTFNKVWITPDEAVVYEQDGVALVGENHLKVMLEGDYLALRENLSNKEFGMDQLGNDDNVVLSEISEEIVRELVIPEIEKEVNEGEHFAPLRQIYHAMILASWFKVRLKNSIINRIYVDQKKVAGINLDDDQATNKIYDQYLEAYKAGVYNFIKEEYDPFVQDVIPRKYFSGGFLVADSAMSAENLRIEPINANSDAAMSYKENGKKWKVVTASLAIAAAAGVVGTSLYNNVQRRDAELMERFGTPKVEVQAIVEIPTGGYYTHVIKPDEIGINRIQTVARQMGVSEELLIKSVGGYENASRMVAGTQVRIPLSDLNLKYQVVDLLDNHFRSDGNITPILRTFINQLDTNFEAITVENRDAMSQIIEDTLRNKNYYTPESIQQVMVEVNKVLEQKSSSDSAQIAEIASVARRMADFDVQTVGMTSLTLLLESLKGIGIGSEYLNRVIELSKEKNGPEWKVLAETAGTLLGITQRQAGIIEAAQQTVDSATVAKEFYTVNELLLGQVEKDLISGNDGAATITTDGILDEVGLSILTQTNLPRLRQDLTRVIDEGQAALEGFTDPLGIQSGELLIRRLQTQLEVVDFITTEKMQTSVQIDSAQRTAFQQNQMTVSQQDLAMSSDIAAELRDIQRQITEIATQVDQDILYFDTGDQRFTENIIAEFVGNNQVIGQMIVDRKNISLEQINTAKNLLQGLKASLDLEEMDTASALTNFTEHVRRNMDSAQIIATQQQFRDNVGGIDLNRQFLDLKTEGEMIDVITPEQLEFLETTPIPGLTPVILDITPGTVNTLPFFAGVDFSKSFEQAKSDADKANVIAKVDSQGWINL